MSSQPTSPGPLPGSSQQQNENNGPPSSSPHSTADSAVHIDENRDRVDADSSFQSNSSERHPKGKRKRTAYVAHTTRDLVNAAGDGPLLTNALRAPVQRTRQSSRQHITPTLSRTRQRVWTS